MMPISGKQTAVIKNAVIPSVFADPENIPTARGYIKFPAPKSIENIARPRVTSSD
jgi:hypothetical protein